MQKHPLIMKSSGPSFFPVLIEFEKTKETRVVDIPEDIPCGVSFRVIMTNYTSEACCGYQQEVDH